MSDHYTDADVQAAKDAILAQYVGPGQEDKDFAEQDARLALDAVAPAIAARAQADILRQFADHDIHGVLPHGDISNDWYHRGIDGAQDEARVWINYVEDGVFRAMADEIERGQS